MVGEGARMEKGCQADGYPGVSARGAGGCSRGRRGGVGYILKA